MKGASPRLLVPVGSPVSSRPAAATPLIVTAHSDDDDDEEDDFRSQDGGGGGQGNNAAGANTSDDHQVTTRNSKATSNGHLAAPSEPSLKESERDTKPEIPKVQNATIEASPVAEIEPHESMRTTPNIPNALDAVEPDPMVPKKSVTDEEKDAESSPTRTVHPALKIHEGEKILYHVDSLSARIWSVSFDGATAEEELERREKQQQEFATNFVHRERRGRETKPLEGIFNGRCSVSSGQCLMTVSQDKASLFCYERGVTLETIHPEHIASIRCMPLCNHSLENRHKGRRSPARRNKMQSSLLFPTPGTEVSPLFERLKAARDDESVASFRTPSLATSYGNVGGLNDVSLARLNTDASNGKKLFGEDNCGENLDGISPIDLFGLDPKSNPDSVTPHFTGTDAVEIIITAVQNTPGDGQRCHDACWSAIALLAPDSKVGDEVMDAFTALKVKYLGVPTKNLTQSTYEKAMVLQHEAKSLLASLGLQVLSGREDSSKEKKSRHQQKQSETEEDYSDVVFEEVTEVEELPAPRQRTPKRLTPRRRQSRSPAASKKRGEDGSTAALGNSQSSQRLSQGELAALSPFPGVSESVSVSSTRPPTAAPSVVTEYPTGAADGFAESQTQTPPRRHLNAQGQNTASPAVSSEILPLHTQQQVIPHQKLPGELLTSLPDAPEVNICRWCHKPCAPEHVPICGYRLIVCPYCIEEQQQEARQRSTHSSVPDNSSMQPAGHHLSPPSALYRAVEFESHKRTCHPEAFRKEQVVKEQEEARKKLMEEREKDPTFLLEDDVQASGRQRPRGKHEEGASYDRDTQLARAVALLESLGHEKPRQKPSSTERRLSREQSRRPHGDRSAPPNLYHQHHSPQVPLNQSTTPVTEVSAMSQSTTPNRWMSDPALTGNSHSSTPLPYKPSPVAGRGQPTATPIHESHPWLDEERRRRSPSTPPPGTSLHPDAALAKSSAGFPDYMDEDEALPIQQQQAPHHIYHQPTKRKAPYVNYEDDSTARENEAHPQQQDTPPLPLPPWNNVGGSSHHQQQPSDNHTTVSGSISLGGVGHTSSSTDGILRQKSRYTSEEIAKPMPMSRGPTAGASSVAASEKTFITVDSSRSKPRQQDGGTTTDGTTSPNGTVERCKHCGKMAPVSHQKKCAKKKVKCKRCGQEMMMKDAKEHRYECRSNAGSH